MKYFPTPAVAVLIFVFALLAGCDSNGSNGVGNGRPGRVLVVNGGNFSDQNGSLTRYDPETDEVTAGPSLNGFLQGLVMHDQRAFVLVNTFSVGHVDILDVASLTSSGRLENLPAPRSMAIVGDTAYIDNLVFGSPGQIVPVSLSTREAGPPIEVGTVPEGMAVMAGRLFIADSGLLGAGRQLFAVSPGSRAVSAVDVPCDGPRDLFPAASGDLIVLCTGKTVYNEDYTEVLSQTAGAVVFLDPNTFQVTGQIDPFTQLGGTNGTVAGFLDYDSGEFYALASEANLVYRINSNTRAIDLVMAVAPADGLIGLSGVAYDPLSERLYLGRFARSSAGEFPDYTSAGSVVVVNRIGEILTTFDVGPAPSQIVLYETDPE